ncbi:MAG: SWIM zinc finger family protein [Deltaproteobacteria bacterium]|nr:SWIM zinc finger family protein [Deltaproteobacteria bacterium]
MHGVVRDGTTVVASVEGQQMYRVRLSLREGNLFADCSCPMGRAGVFCKHCVAAGLAWIEGPLEATSRVGSTESAGGLPDAAALDDFSTDLDRIREHLAQLEPSTLVEMLIEQALWDDNLLRRLTMAAARSDEVVNIKTMRHAITEATRTGGFVDYGAAPHFARGIEDLVHAVSQLLEESHANEVIKLSEYALRRVERALEHMDDSDGYMRPILDDLQTLHHAACVKAHPDPVKLARRIFEWEINGDWDIFYGASRTYADVFGETGLAEYRKLAENLWQDVPQLGSNGEGRTYEHPRFRLTAMMEALATELGDVEALVAIKSRDLSSAFRYLQIAETYKEAGEPDKALAWAEKGVRAFSSKTDSRLREFLAEEYHRLGRHGDAVGLIWQNFSDHSNLSYYQALKQHAEQTSEWPRWRKKALAHFGERERTDAWLGPRERWTMGPLNFGSELVAIFLWEKDVDAAWEEACQRGCSSDQWMELARLREDGHPEDALRVYQDEVQRLVNQTNNPAYKEAIDWVRHIRRLLRKTGQEDQFGKYVAELEVEFKRKRNFMKLLNGLP